MSRRLDDIHPLVRARCAAHIAACHAEGIDLLITSTLRTRADQAALYAQGRTAGSR